MHAALRQGLVVLVAAALGALLVPARLPFAVGIGVGGLAVVLGNVAAARVALPAGVHAANAVMLRWFAGIALRWMVLGGVLLGAIVAWRLPPLALLLGVLVALVAQVVITTMLTVRNSK